MDITDLRVWLLGLLFYVAYIFEEHHKRVDENEKINAAMKNGYVQCVEDDSRDVLWKKSCDCEK